MLGFGVLLIGLVFSPDLATAYTLSVTDDVMVGRYKYGSEPYTYYDSEWSSQMQTGYYSSTSYASYNYYSYLQFDLSSVPDDYNLSTAVLRLYVITGTNQSPYVSHISDDSWDEDTINWGDLPASDGLIADQVDWGYSPGSEWVDISLTGWSYQADLLDNALSVVLTPWTSGNYGPTMTYRTRDYSFGEFAATLELTGEEGAPIPEPATMLLLGSGLVGLAGFRRKKFKK